MQPVSLTTVNKMILLEVLRDGTALVAALQAGEMTADEFLRKYDNFYYHNALDGHEADAVQRAVLDAHRSVCELHARVQGVVDLVYYSDVPLADYEAAGRIRPEEVARRVAALAADFDARTLCEQLDENVMSSRPRETDDDGA